MGSLKRKTSGEIINATLLEVFLALVFIVFALAIFEQQRAEGALSAAHGTIPKDSAAHMAKQISFLRDSVGILTRKVDSLQKFIAGEPNCDANETPLEFVQIVLTSPSEVLVTPLRTKYGFEREATIRVPLGKFTSTFGTLHTYTREHHCFLAARIIDTDRTSKADYKRSLAMINSIFRLKGFLR